MYVVRVLFVFVSHVPVAATYWFLFKVFYLIQYVVVMDGSCLPVCGLLLRLVLYQAHDRSYSMVMIRGLSFEAYSGHECRP